MKFPFFRKKVKSPPPKPLLICIHGFGKRRNDEWLPLIAYFEPLGYEISTPVLFEPRDPEDTDAQKWIERAEQVVDQALGQNREVILIGYSMGGVIAAYLASIKPVKRLVLLAPAFQYMTLSNAAGALSSLFETKKEEPDNEPYVSLPSQFTNTFMEVVEQLKNVPGAVHCPTLILHGTDDKTIPFSSSRRILKKIPAPKKALLLLEGVSHHILPDPIYGQVTLTTIQNFIEETILPTAKAEDQ